MSKGASSLLRAGAGSTKASTGSEFNSLGAAGGTLKLALHLLQCSAVSKFVRPHSPHFIEDIGVIHGGWSVIRALACLRRPPINKI